ncbi:uncharacterized protein plekhg6 [Mugil cephalus]|uniref:uncharacterized protein plekhg6 n=1 Tax=Mugil cephalus TaxID=48193 RepID=UPI001FB5C131|nr:uncharacterized protein plekhg6 [Mugil cephalus]
MDPAKPSLASKAWHTNNEGGTESQKEEMVHRRGSADGERQRDVEARDADVVDGTTAAAELHNLHKVSADKHKLRTRSFQRRTKQKVVTDFTTVGKAASAGTKPRAALRQVLFNQGVPDKTSEERGQLDLLKQNLEAYTVPAGLKWRWNEENQGTTLEKNWTDIVTSHSTMSKMQRHQQEALWEFVHTELSYINKLIIIKDLVSAALLNLHQNGFLLEVTPERLFSNLPSILNAHQLFWQEVIYPMLYHVRRTGTAFDPLWLEAGCLQFHERFSSYQHYCWEEENNLEFARRQMESNPHFHAYIQWVETHPQCERMRLGDMQAKPHQRITKYPLLVKAVLENTQDPHVQHTLRGMLSSLNSFLESINEYLRINDERLALSISAQRVEGYEVEGINEEIDKHVQGICRFNLTCPIRGVGPDVVRKLLLEENLKVRGRKDSKLEVVALLFSDVLLMTKVQKKGERLKVVRAPLALDRTYCAALKDGYSFVLVEVGELQSVMNVLILVASTSESCSTWVSTIQQAKELLVDLREKESNRLENLKIHRLEAKPVTEAKDKEEPIILHAGRETCVDELTDEDFIPHSINGSKEAERYQTQEDMATNNGVSWRSQTRNNNRTFGHKSTAGQQQVHKQSEWIEMDVRNYQRENHREEENQIAESQLTNEQNVTWQQRVQSAPNLDNLSHRPAADQPRFKTTLSHNLLPDVDYPINEDSTLYPHNQPAKSKEGSEFLGPQGQRGTLRRASDSQSVNQDTRRNSSCSQSEDMETSPDVWSFSKNLKSPGLRKRRPVNTNQEPPSQTSKQFFQASRQTPNYYSSSNSDSDCNTNMKRNSLPSSSSSDSHRVFKLGSLKPNQGEFWNVQGRGSPDHQTVSEPELPDLNFQNNKPRMRTQRSASNPNIVIEGGPELHLHSSRIHTSPTEPKVHNPNGQPSPLVGLLEKAKEREKDRSGLKRDRNMKMNKPQPRNPSPSPSFSTTPSPSSIDGHTELKHVELMRHRVLTVSKGWREQLVDGDDDDDKRNSGVYTDGVNVDWTGWVFDDIEVMDHLHPAEEGLLEGISKSLVSMGLSELSEQEDGECSQV